MEVKRGEIYLAEIDGKGHEQKGYLPVIIVQNDKGNRCSPTTIVVYMTKKEPSLPTHSTVVGEGRLSTAMCEHVRTISKERLAKKVGQVSEDEMAEITLSLKVSLGMAV